MGRGRVIHLRGRRGLHHFRENGFVGAFSDAGPATRAGLGINLCHMLNRYGLHGTGLDAYSTTRTLAFVNFYRH